MQIPQLWLYFLTYLLLKNSVNKDIITIVESITICSARVFTLSSHLNKRVKYGIAVIKTVLIAPIKPNSIQIFHDDI
jgi:hypothetical protein